MSFQESPPGPQELLSYGSPPTKSGLIFSKFSVLIFSNLPQHDQAQCALVCRSWFTVATTKLWSTISITDRRAYYCFLAPEAQEALIKNCHLVRSFRTNYIAVIQSLFNSSLLTTSSTNPEDANTESTTDEGLFVSSPFSTSSTNPADASSESTADETSCRCANLVHLDLGGLWRVPPPPKKKGQESTYQSYNRRTPRPPLTPLMEQLIYRVIQSNPHLKDLIIGNYISNRDGLVGILTHQQLAELETLDLFRWHGGYFHHGNPDKRFTETFLEQSPKSLREMSMVLNAVETSEPLRYYIRNTKSSPQRPRLEPVSVPGGKLFSAPSSEHVTIKFMHNFSRRPRTVCLPWQAHHTSPINGATDFADRASEHPSKPQAQSATGPGSNTETCVVFPSLTDQDSLVVARHVHSNSQDLQEFHLWCYNLLVHAVFPDILYKASNLTVLRAPLLSLPRDVAGTTMTPTAQAIFQLPWATRSLRVLELHILGVPRPDISVGEFGKPVNRVLFEGTVQESHTVQHAVYRQLAKQAEIEELVLGNGHYKTQGERVIDAQGRSLYGGPGFQLNCLAMSLESGLDILGGLSQLRVLDVSRTAHRVGVPELKWMQSHWPRIERVSGLFNRRYPGEPGVRDWLAEQDPIWGSEYQGYVFSADGLCGVPNDSLHRDAIAVFHC